MVQAQPESEDLEILSQYLRDKNGGNGRGLSQFQLTLLLTTGEDLKTQHLGRMAFIIMHGSLVGNLFLTTYRDSTLFIRVVSSALKI